LSLTGKKTRFSKKINNTKLAPVAKKINSCLNYAKAILNLKLSQKLSPQQIQLMKLIQLPTQAFEQRLLEEMNENPL
jgi:hypothetical protein